MAFFEQAITVLQTLVIALGAGLGIWGVINLLEGYGNDNPGAKSQGMKQLMADYGYTSAGHELLHALALGAGVVVAVTFQQVDDTPDTKTSAQSDNESLKNGNCLFKKCHK